MADLLTIESLEDSSLFTFDLPEGFEEEHCSDGCSVRGTVNENIALLLRQSYSHLNYKDVPTNVKLSHFYLLFDSLGDYIHCTHEDKHLFDEFVSHFPACITKFYDPNFVHTSALDSDLRTLYEKYLTTEVTPFDEHALLDVIDDVWLLAD